MLTDKKYKISDLKSIIAESYNESKPVYGKNVIRDNAKNNVKAVDDIKKETDKFNPKSLRDENKTNPTEEKDVNKTTLDVKFAYEPSDDYKKRVKSQVEGFPSVDNKKNTDSKDYEGLDYDGNEKFYKNTLEVRKDINKKEADDKHAGLKSNNLPKENFKNNTLYTNENKKMKRLHFKNTQFLSEESMLKKIPEDYKKDGNKFIMKDSTGTEYMIECIVDDRFNFAKFNVLNKINKKQISEELTKIKNLYEYESGNCFNSTTSKLRKDENANLNEMIDTVKKLKE